MKYTYVSSYKNNFSHVHVSAITRVSVSKHDGRARIIGVYVHQQSH